MFPCMFFAGIQLQDGSERTFTIELEIAAQSFATAKKVESRLF
jgi:hypothetical protein